jgi:hypothetical protein
LLAPTLTSLFPESLCGLTPPPAPVPLRDRVHPSMRLPLQSTNCFEPAPRVSTRGRLSWGFFPHRGISVRSPLASEFPSPRPDVPSSAFLTPSTVCSSVHLAGLFHPAATSGIHLSGVISRYPAGPPRRRPVPSCRFSTRPYRRVAPTAPDRADPPTGS